MSEAATNALTIEGKRFDPESHACYAEGTLAPAEWVDSVKREKSKLAGETANLSACPHSSPPMHTHAQKSRSPHRNSTAVTQLRTFCWRQLLSHSSRTTSIGRPPPPPPPPLSPPAPNPGDIAPCVPSPSAPIPDASGPRSSDHGGTVLDEQTATANPFRRSPSSSPPPSPPPPALRACGAGGGNESWWRWRPPLPAPCLARFLPLPALGGSRSERLGGSSA